MYSFLLVLLVYQRFISVYESTNLQQHIGEQDFLLNYKSSPSTRQSLFSVSSQVSASAIYHPIYAVSPAHRLSACAIPKNMSTVLVAILCLLFDPARWSSRGFSLTTDVNRSCSGSNELHRVRQLQKLGASNWTNLMFVREPTERFLSGYLYMCSPGSAFGGNCFDCGDDVICVLRRLYAAAVAFSEGDLTAESNELWHLGPQTWHCEFSRQSQMFTVVKYSPSKKEALAGVLRDVLTGSNVEETMIESIVGEVFGKKTIHTTTDKAGREELLKRLETEEARRLMTAVFYWDYVHFGYPMPTI